MFALIARMLKYFAACC